MLICFYRWLINGSENEIGPGFTDFSRGIIISTFWKSPRFNGCLSFAEYQLAAQLKQISIRYTDPGPIIFDADPDMILTILRNIMSNAVKFTFPDGYVQVVTGKSASMVTIEISDNGVGIAPEDQEKLLQLNAQYKSKGTGGEPGSGLGLILCREYIEMHKGSISIVSEKGKGSTFTICLPVIGIQ